MIKHPGRLISILYRKGLIYKNIHFKDINITASEQPFMSALFWKDGVSQDLLSRYLYIDKASTARTIQSLIKKGLVKKIKDKEDKRINRIFLTKKGYSYKDEIFSVLDDWGDILTSDMNSEEKDIAYEYLERMVKNVESYIEDKKKIQK